MGHGSLEEAGERLGGKAKMKAIMFCLVKTPYGLTGPMQHATHNCAPPSAHVQWSAESSKDPLHGPLEREYLSAYVVSVEVGALACRGS
jgi:hypothetical protein